MAAIETYWCLFEWGIQLLRNTDRNATRDQFYNLSRNAFCESIYYFWFGLNLMQHLTIESLRI